MQKYNTIANFCKKLNNYLRNKAIFVRNTLFIINYKKE